MTALAEIWLPVIGAGIFIAWAIGAWYGGNKTTAVWLVFGGAVCLLLLGTIQWQHAIHAAETRKEDPSRAYVFPDATQVIHPVGGPAAMSVTIKNSGQSPAYDLTWRCQFVVAKIEGEGDISIDPIEATKQNLPTGQSLSYVYKFETWNSEADELLSEGKAAIYIKGEIRYKDAAGVDRYTDFLLKSGGRFGIKTGIAPGTFGAVYVKSN
jgi:hypothetical protein